MPNLENVQGDERDVIFISTTYGPDAETGHVYQRFGPINRPTGWRRLNVIVTRAKQRIEVFTSMRSSDIRITPGASQGVVALRNYLEYVESGKIPELGVLSDREPGSDFELAVGKVLMQNGYRVAYQVGVAGFFIDIGVYHPYRSGEFLVGVECDGATYHSEKSIRDRDLLRQQILESKGWTILRIWSTDWFKNRDSEVNALLGKLDELLEAQGQIVGEIVAESETEQRPGEPTFQEGEFVAIPAETERTVEEALSSATDEEDALRQALLEYRRRKIEPSAERLDRSILSDLLLEEFVRRKPTEREEFLRFPLHLRSTIEPSEGALLEEILGIIEAYAD